MNAHACTLSVRAKKTIIDIAGTWSSENIILIIMSNVWWGYSFGSQEEKNCGAPCHAMFFAEKERTVLRYWVASWAALCCASCLFTVSINGGYFQKYVHTDIDAHPRRCSPSS